MYRCFGGWAAATVVALILAAPAAAQLRPLGYYRLGEDDAGAAAGGNVTTTVESVGQFENRDMSAILDVDRLKYSSDTPGYATSTLSVQFNSSEAHLFTDATAWYSGTGGFRWGMELFMKPDPSLQGQETIFFTNGSQFTMGFDVDGLFYVNSTGPGTTPVKFGEWQHVAFITTGSFWQIYVDGVAQFATLPNFNYGAPSGFATLGADNFGDPQTAFNGLIDEHRVFTWVGAFNPNELLWFQLRPEGDVNEDGVVDALDYNIWRENVGADLTGVSGLDGRARGDLNGDRQINLLDFGIIKANKAPGVTFGEVPEPAGAVLALAGLGWLATRRRGRRQRALLAVALTASLTLLAADNASAQATWGGGDGNWNDANWTGGSGPGGAPGAGDSIVLPPTTGTLTVSGLIGPVFNTMNQQGGVLNIAPAGSLEFSGLFENGKGGAANGGEVNVAGTLVIGAGFDVARDTAGTIRVLGSGTLSVGGTMDTWWAPGAVVDITGGGADFSVNEVLYYGPSATFNANLNSSSFSTVKVFDTLSIQGGTLNVNFVDGYVPALGSSWTLFDAANRAGQIPNVNANGLVPGTRVVVDYPAGGTLGQTVTATVASTLNLKADAATGVLTIENPAPGAGALDIDGYIIRSASSSLNAAGFTGVGQAGWLPGLTPSQSDAILSETNLNGSLVVNPGASVALGSAFDGFGSQDLAFEFRLVSGEVLKGSIEYVGSPSLPADFDNNGLVNEADLAIWEAGFGTATGGTKATGDYNLDGAVDGADFLGWQREAGTGALAAASSSAVPEPTAGALLACWACGVVGLRTRRR